MCTNGAICWRKVPAKPHVLKFGKKLFTIEKYGWCYLKFLIILQTSYVCVCTHVYMYVYVCVYMHNYILEKNVQLV